MGKLISIKGYNEDVVLDARILRALMFGSMLSEEDSFRQMDHFAELGGRTFDTAAVYGDWDGLGKHVCELTIGKWLKVQPNASEFCIITKGGHYNLKNPEISRVTTECICSDIEQSLQALGVNSIDVYLLHRDNPDIPVSEIMECLNNFVKAGKLKAIGTANWTTRRICEANAYAKEHGLQPFTCSEIQWGLAVPTEIGDTSEIVYMTSEEYRHYMEMGITVLGEDVLQNGLFANWMEDLSTELPDEYRGQSTRMVFDTARKFCEETKITPSQMAISYVMNHNFPGGAIFAVNNLGEMDEYMKASELDLPEKVESALNEPRYTKASLYEDQVSRLPQMRTLTIQTGSNNITVSRIICGMAQLGSNVDEDTSFAIMDAYYESGGRTFDTAQVYGTWGEKKESLSEICLGKWMKARGVRKDVQIITKGCHPDIKHMDIPRVGAEFIETDLEDSLKTLQTDYIDIYQLHRDNPEIPVSGIINSLNKLLNQGKIRSFSASNWATARIEEANAYARKNGLEGFTSSEVNRCLAVMNPGSMGKDIPEVTEQDLEYYKQSKLPILSWGSLGGGIIIKNVEGQLDSLSPVFLGQYMNSATMCRIKNVKRMMQESGISATELCIAYVTNHPISAAAIIGASSAMQMERNLQAANLEISETMVRDLEYLSAAAIWELEQQKEGGSKHPLNVMFDMDTNFGDLYDEDYIDVVVSHMGQLDDSYKNMLERMTFRQIMKIPGAGARMNESDLEKLFEALNIRREELLAKN